MEGLTITDAMLYRTFDAASIRRGAQFARRGFVLATSVHWVESVFDLRGQVRGSTATPFDVAITVRPDLTDPDASRVESRCTCEAYRECQHAVAVLSVVRSAQSRRPSLPVPAWQRTLDALLAEDDEQAPVSGGGTPLGLRFELPPTHRRQWARGSHRHLWLRVVRAGARGSWAKGGITWATTLQPELDQVHDRTHLEVLSGFARTVTGASPREVINLASIGPGFVDLLEQAKAAGIALVGGERISSVQVSSDPLSISLDVAAGEGDTQVRVGVWHDDDFLADADLFLLGRQPHSVGLVRAVRANTTAAQPKVHLTVAPLAHRVPAALVSLHRSGAPLTVPASARAELEGRYLPRLAQQLPVTSADGSVDVVQEQPPVLQVLVDWQGVEVTLQWQFRYPDGTVVRADAPGRSAVRRPRAERALVAEVAEFSHLQPAGRFVGLGARAFAEAELPRLRSHQGVQLIETGQVPVFREAVGQAQIEFVAPSEPDSTQTAAGQLGATDWLDLAVVITVDGEQVPLAEVLTALTQGVGELVLPSGLVLSTDRPEFRRLADLVAAAAQIRDHDGDGVRVGSGDLGLWHDLAELGLVDARAAHWVEAARALVGRETLPEVDVAGLSTELRSYQLEGVRWLVHLWSLGLGGILADDMGLGKTVQTLALIAHARDRGAQPFLVLAPTSVMTAWAHEASRHTPGLRVCVIDASERRRGSALADAVAGADVVVTSYTLLRLEADAYAEMTWGGVVLDEAQALKNHRSRTHAAVRRLQAPFRLAVTGTPFENRLMELWALLVLVAPGLYPSPQQFTDQVVTPVEKHGDQAALARFRSRVRPFVLRRTKDIVASDLPAKQDQVLEVVLEPRHQKIYDTWLQRERQAILGLVDDFDTNRMAIFTALTRLRQLSLDPALVDEEYEAVGSAKLDMLTELLVELAAEGHRALVFSQFTSFLTRARTRLEANGVSCRYLDGSTRRRGAEIDAFKNGEGDAFLISLKAGGVGLTLTEADYVFMLDPWWNPAAEAQAVDRAHRIGQHRPVMVYRLVSRGTIEEKVMALKERKAALFASVFTGDGAVGTGIDADDVRALFD